MFASIGRVGDHHLLFRAALVVEEISGLQVQKGRGAPEGQAGYNPLPQFPRAWFPMINPTTPEF